MAAQLAGIKGAFVLSINVPPEVREIFGAFHLHKLQLSYAMSQLGVRTALELVVSNRERERRPV